MIRRCCCLASLLVLMVPGARCQETDNPWRLAWTHPVIAEAAHYVEGHLGDAEAIPHECGACLYENAEYFFVEFPSFVCRMQGFPQDAIVAVHDGEEGPELFGESLAGLVPVDDWSVVVRIAKDGKEGAILLTSDKLWYTPKVFVGAYGPLERCQIFAPLVEQPDDPE